MYKTRQAALDAANRLEKAYDQLTERTAARDDPQLRLLLALFEYLLGNDDKNPLVDLFKEK